MPTFTDLLDYQNQILRKEARYWTFPSDIDHYVRDWHRLPYTQSLREFLGMTNEEYKYWAETGDITSVALARNGLSLGEARKVVSDNPFAYAEKPYICVTGFDTKEHIAEMRGIVPMHAMSHLFVAGILVSRDSLNGKPKPRYPAGSDIKRMCEEAKDVGLIPTIHYCPKNNESWECEEDLQKLTDLDCGAAGIQINTISLVRTDIIARTVAKLNPHWNVVFQLNGSLLRTMSPYEAVKAFSEMSPRLHKAYVLFDPSGGTGKSVFDLIMKGKALDSEPGDIMDSVANVNAFKRMCHLANLVPGFAGGLNPNNLGTALTLFGRDVCLDTESGVRTGDNVFIPERAKAFYEVCKYAMPENR